MLQHYARVLLAWRENRYIEIEDEGRSCLVVGRGTSRRGGNKRGSRRGCQNTSEFPHMQYDTNYWRTFVHARYRPKRPAIAGLTLFGKSESEHRAGIGQQQREYRLGHRFGSAHALHS